MKKLLLALALLIGLTAGAQTVALNSRIAAAEPKPSQFLLISASTGAAVPATNAVTKYTSATFYGYKTLSATAAPTANTAAVYLGFTDHSSTDTTTATNICDTIAAGSYLSVIAPPGTKFDLSDVRLVGTTGDKVLIVFEQ